VLVTSDHGGRAVTRHLACDPSAPPGSVFRDSTGAPIPGLPPYGTPAPFISGDHVVVYGAHPITAPALWYWDGARVGAAVLPAATASRSFHPNQTPEWLLLPRRDEQYADAPNPAATGGTHGACVDVGPPAQLSGVDADVPCVVLGGTPGGWKAPRELASVASAFLGL
jgi:hypothetical protein